MGVRVDVVAGPAHVWVARVGSVFPEPDGIIGSAWLSLGQTVGGVSVDYKQSVVKVQGDLGTGTIYAYRDMESLTVSFAIVSSTLALLSKALNDAAIEAIPGDDTVLAVPLYQGPPVARYALLVRGPSPYVEANHQQYQVPVVSQLGDIRQSYGRDGMSVVPFSLEAIEDPAALAANLRFGQLIALSGHSGTGTWPNAYSWPDLMTWPG